MFCLLNTDTSYNDIGRGWGPNVSRGDHIFLKGFLKYLVLGDHFRGGGGGPIFRQVLLIQPSSAVAEHVFSLLANSFGANQDLSLQDYIKSFLMLMQ